MKTKNLNWATVKMAKSKGIKLLYFEIKIINKCIYGLYSQEYLHKILREKNVFSRSNFSFATYVLKNGSLSFESSFEWPNNDT